MALPIDQSSSLGIFTKKSALASVSNASARPQFELQFNILQNTLINRLNDKIVEAQEVDLNSKVESHLKIEYKKFARMQPLAADYYAANGKNVSRLTNIVESLEQLDGYATAGNTEKFNETLAFVNELVGQLKTADGAAIGIIAPDRLNTLRAEGLDLAELGSYADADEAKNAIETVRDSLLPTYNQVLSNQSTARRINSFVNRKLTTLQTTIEAQKETAKYELLGEVAKMRQEMASQLDMLSMAFDSQQVITDKIAKGLSGENQVDKGSVISMFI